jgi:type II secretion system protein H
MAANCDSNAFAASDSPSDADKNGTEDCDVAALPLLGVRAGVRAVHNPNSARRISNKSRAFTLIELVLVMALLTIVLAVAFPSLRNFFRGRNLDSEARRFLALTRYAQSRAVSEGVPMVLWIDAKQRTYGLQAQTGYLDEDDKAVEFALDETLEFKVTTPSVRQTAMQRNETVSVAGNLPAIRYSPDGFIGQTSPDEVTIRQGDEDAVVFAPNANRLNYEIQPTKPQLARR